MLATLPPPPDLPSIIIWLLIAGIAIPLIARYWPFRRR